MNINNNPPVILSAASKNRLEENCRCGTRIMIPDTQNINKKFCVK
jgi:hypothetical protein